MNTEGLRNVSTACYQLLNNLHSCFSVGVTTHTCCQNFECCFKAGGVKHNRIHNNQGVITMITGLCHRCQTKELSSKLTNRSTHSGFTTCIA